MCRRPPKDFPLFEETSHAGIDATTRDERPASPVERSRRAIFPTSRALDMLIATERRR